MPPSAAARDLGNSGIYSHGSDSIATMASPNGSLKRKRNHGHDVVEDNFSSSDLSGDEMLDEDIIRSSKRSKPDGLLQFATDSPGLHYPTTPRNLKRKMKNANLSNLSLRHQAQKQEEEQQEALKEEQRNSWLKIRESKFREGSLNDKPSDQPPSTYTRADSASDGHAVGLDRLLAQFHNTEAACQDPAKANASVTDPVTAQADQTSSDHKKENSGGFFRLGRTFASNFHPIALWNKLWNESKEELIREDAEKAARKAKQKVEAEARYATMKRAGQLSLQQVSRSAIGVVHPAYESTTSDSNAGSFLDTSRPSTSEEESTLHTSEAMDGTIKPARGFGNRLNFKRPSLSNLKGLKRARSDLSIGPNPPIIHSLAQGIDIGSSTLRQSTSKYDLKKKQKLSRRVSDLEAKLDQARRELDEALIEASPRPKAEQQHDRFTASRSFRKSRFVPGALPSLPSERLLMAGLQSSDENERGTVRARAGPVNASNFDVICASLNPEKPSLTEEGDENEETIKPPRARQYPARAISVFTSNSKHHESGQKTNHLSQSVENMVMTTATEADHMVNEEALPESHNYTNLDAKLKALDANIKIANQSSKPKKRKATVDEADKAFKSQASQEDDEDEDDTPRKKKKRLFGNKESSDSQGHTNKKTKRTGEKYRVKKSMTLVQPGSKTSTLEAQTESSVANTEESDYTSSYETDMEGRRSVSLRSSISSQGQPLEPLYEEEEEVVVVPLNDEPSKPTAKATPARYGRPNRTSASPHKMTTEETMIGRAEQAVHEHRRIPSKSSSGAHSKFEWPDDVF